MSDETKHIEEKVESDYYQDKFQLLKENYDNVIEENEIFRKGIQEIVIILKENSKFIVFKIKAMQRFF